MKKVLKLLIALSPIISASAIALKFKPPKKEVFNFNNPLNEEKNDMDDLEYQHMINKMTCEYWEHRAGKATRFPNANVCDKGNKTDKTEELMMKMNSKKKYMVYVNPYVTPDFLSGGWIIKIDEDNYTLDDSLRRAASNAGVYSNISEAKKALNWFIEDEIILFSKIIPFTNEELHDLCEGEKNVK